jgi:ankyrin repeat protein
MWSIKAGYTEISRLLIERGADITMKNEKNNDALSLARERASYDVIKIIEGRLNDNAVKKTVSDSVDNR